MSCNCNKGCGSRTVITEKGERGPQGPPGPSGPNISGLTSLVSHERDITPLLAINTSTPVQHGPTFTATEAGDYIIEFRHRARYRGASQLIYNIYKDGAVAVDILSDVDNVDIANPALNNLLQTNAIKRRFSIAVGEVIDVRYSNGAADEIDIEYVEMFIYKLT